MRRRCARRAGPGAARCAPAQSRVLPAPRRVASGPRGRTGGWREPRVSTRTAANSRCALAACSSRVGATLSGQQRIWPLRMRSASTSASSACVCEQPPVPSSSVPVARSSASRRRTLRAAGAGAGAGAFAASGSRCSDATRGGEGERRRRGSAAAAAGAPRSPRDGRALRRLHAAPGTGTQHRAPAASPPRPETDASAGAGAAARMPPACFALSPLKRYAAAARAQQPRTAGPQSHASHAHARRLRRSCAVRELFVLSVFFPYENLIEKSPPKRNRSS
jgi:hypothetical protein